MTLRELLGERTSVAIDFLQVHLGAALQAAARRARAASRSERLAHARREVLQLELAARELADALAAARARAWDLEFTGGGGRQRARGAGRRAAAAGLEGGRRARPSSSARAGRGRA